jgi:hypothetical protein
MIILPAFLIFTKVILPKTKNPFQLKRSMEKQTIFDTKIIRAILIAGLLVATFDLAMATIQTLAYGRNPVRMFQFIASGVFGPESFLGGWQYAALGIIFHYCIATSWTALFFLLYPKIHLLSKNKILNGIGYGLFVWLMMNRIILPLSNVNLGPFNWTSAFIGASILVVAIGLPLSFLANRFYNPKQS